MAADQQEIGAGEHLPGQLFIESDPRPDLAGETPRQRADSSRTSPMKPSRFQTVLLMLPPWAFAHVVLIFRVLPQNDPFGVFKEPLYRMIVILLAAAILCDWWLDLPLAVRAVAALLG